MRPTLGARATRLRRGFAIALAATALLANTAAGADSTIRGGCTAVGTSTSGGVIDLTTNAIWHVQSTDQIHLAGQAPTPQTSVSVKATAFGFAIPIGGGTADPNSSAESDTYEISTLAILGRVFLISGVSSGPGGGCDGEVELIIDDVNPILTVLGGAGLAGLLIGLLGLGWAVRKPEGLRRRLVGLGALALMGIGGSLLLQQVVPPGDPSFSLAHSPFVDSVLSPTQLMVNPELIAKASLLTIAILVLLPFPSQLFNSTLEQNYDSIRAGFRRMPLVGRLLHAPSDEPVTRPTGIAHWLLIAAFVLVSGLLYGLLDPTFGLDERSLITYAGIVTSLVIVTWAAALPSRAMHARLVGDRGYASALAGTLVVAAICVLISRLVGFLPGYLYGLVLGFSFLKSIEPAQDGRAGHLGAWWMLAIAFIAWLTLGAVRIPGVEDTLPAIIIASVLAALTVAGIEGIVFSMMPLRFLPGELVYRFQRWRWAALYAIGLFGFVMILLNPATGYIPSQNGVPFVMAVALFVAFGVVSVLFWGYFRFRPKHDSAAAE